MLKVHILDRCQFCDGEAYLLAGEGIDANGTYYPQYEPCAYCHGSGELDKWVSLPEFANLLDRAIAMEPDWRELASEKPMTQYMDSREAAGI